MADWDAVATAIKSRMRELQLTQMDLAAKSGVSIATIRELQHNTAPRRRSPRTLAAISTALRWPPDHLERVSEGATDERGELAQPSVEYGEVMSHLDSLQEQVESVGERLSRLEQLILPADQLPSADASPDA
jgi:transcriptional regulator with XRE-family HTH domain